MSWMHVRLLYLSACSVEKIGQKKKLHLLNLRQQNTGMRGNLTTSLHEYEIIFVDWLPLQLRYPNFADLMLHQLQLMELKQLVSKSIDVKHKLVMKLYLNVILIISVIPTFIVMSIPLVATTQSSGWDWMQLTTAEKWLTWELLQVKEKGTVGRLILTSFISLKHFNKSACFLLPYKPSTIITSTSNIFTCSMSSHQS